MFESLKVWLIRRAAKRRLGHIIQPLEALSTHPGLLIPYTRFSLGLERTHQVDARLKMLAVIRTANLVACPF